MSTPALAKSPLRKELRNGDLKAVLRGEQEIVLNEAVGEKP